MKALLLFAALSLTLSTFCEGEPLQRDGLQLDLPSHWYAEEPDSGDPTLIFRLRPKDQHGALVVIRRHPVSDSTLNDIVTRLRYAIILRQEGRIQSKRSFQLAGRAGLKINYSGRSTTGPLKNFVRYLTLLEDEALMVHCVCSDRASQDEKDFLEMVERLRYSPMPEEGPETTSPPVNKTAI